MVAALLSSVERRARLQVEYVGQFSAGQQVIPVIHRIYKRQDQWF